MSKDERLKIVLAIMIVIVTTTNRINNNNILTNKTKNHGKRTSITSHFRVEEENKTLSLIKRVISILVQDLFRARQREKEIEPSLS
jgi:hypothetical protein